MSTRSVKRLGRSFVGSFVLFALLAVVGVAAFRVLFPRSGEAAIAYIPVDADAVLTLDTNPSERQASTFKLINERLASGGVQGSIDKMLTSMMPDSGIVRDLRPFLTASGAFAHWEGMGKGKGHDLCLIALRDPGGAQKAVAKYEKDASGCYSMQHGQCFVKLIDSYFVVGSDAEVIKMAEDARSSGKSVSTLAEFAAARKSVPADANLMAFFSPRLIKKISEEGGKNVGTNSLPDWGAASITIEPDGLRIDGSGEMLRQKGGIESKPITPRVLQMLPAGPVGFAAGGPNVGLDKMMEEALSDADVLKASKEVKDASGFDLTKDIASTFAGDKVIAVYMSTAGKQPNGDIVAVLSGEGSANPAEVAERVRRAVQDKNPDVKIAETQVGSDSVFEFKPDTKAFSPPPMPDSGRMQFPKSPEGDIVIPQRQPSPEGPMSDKSLVWAIHGRDLVIASSRPMILRVLQGGEANLAADPLCKDVLRDLNSGVQCAFAVSPVRIADALRPYVESWGGKKSDIDEALAYFGGGSRPIYGVENGDGRHVTAHLTIPVSWDKVTNGLAHAMTDRRMAMR